MHEELRRLETEVTTALRGLDLCRTQATPLSHPEKWSIQQIIEHLLQTYSRQHPCYSGTRRQTQRDARGTHLPTASQSIPSDRARQLS